MEVNSRMLQLIELLLSADGSISVEDALKAVDYSQRTLFYNLEKVNAYFAEIDVQPVVRQKGMLIWDVSQADHVRSCLTEQAAGIYALSKTERKAIILVRVATSHQPVTVELLSSLFDISRNTILSEIKELRQELAQIGIELDSAGRAGYQLAGDEITIRFKTMECIHSLATQRLQQDMLQHLIENAGVFCGRTLTQTDFAELQRIVSDCEALVQVKYNYASINEAVSYLLLIAIRAGKGRNAVYLDDMEGCPEYEAAGRIIDALLSLGIVIPQKEQGYVTAVLLASKLYDDDRSSPDADIDLLAFSQDLVDVFSAKACVQFKNRDELVKRLLFHVRPMYYRLRYRIKVRNVLADEIRKRYAGLYKLTELAVRSVEEKYGLFIPTEEIAYICVYIGGWIDERLLLEPEIDENTVIIVCGAGIGTSLLLRTQMVGLLGSEYNYYIMEERDAAAVAIADCALIISAVDLGLTQDNYIRVNPILTKSQQKKILNWALTHKGAQHTVQVKQLLELIEEYAHIEDREALAFSLLNYLTDGIAELPARGSVRLQEALSSNLVQLVDREDISVNEALELACKPLVDSGIVRCGYHRSIEELVDRLGLYSEIAPRIMLAHGIGEGYVKALGISLSVFKTPVFFPKWDKEISAIFVLSAPDNESHLPILEDIMKLVQSPSACQRLAVGDFTDDRALRDYIINSLKQENN